MSLDTWAQIATTVVIGFVGLIVKRHLDRQDRDRAAQTTLLKDIALQVSGIVRDFAALKVTVEHHDDEISRFRDMIDRWNTGPRP